MKKNEGYVKLISMLQKENKEFRLQIKNMEDLHKTVSLSQRDRKSRCALLKAQARKLKFKQSTSSKSEEDVDTTSPPS